MKICGFCLLAVTVIVLFGSMRVTAGQPDAPSHVAATGQPHTKTLTRYELPPDKLVKAEALYRTRTLLYLVSLLVSVGVLLLVIELRIGPRYRDLAERLSTRRVVQALVFVPLLLLTLAVASMPVDVYQQHIMRAYGLSVQGWGSWLWDWTKAQLISAVIFTPLVLALFAIIRRSPRRWWFYFWLLTVPVVVFLVFLTPVVLDPLFNSFEPLDRRQPQLIEPMQRIATRGGLQIPRSRMFEMKASEKVTTYNAYVTGLGATKRIVVWDNTARDMTVPETLFVFGHEMGHYVLGHVYKLLAFGLVTLFICFWLGRMLVLWMLARRGERWQVRGVNDWASLPLLFLTLSVLTIAATPLFSAFSRHQEHQADIYGLEVTHGITPDSGQVAAAAFQKLGEKALSYPSPNPLLVLWSYDHPPIAERLVFSVHYRPWDTPPGPTYVK
jgi:STE24 endopeptidase